MNFWQTFSHPDYQDTVLNSAEYIAKTVMSVPPFNTLKLCCEKPRDRPFPYLQKSVLDQGMLQRIGRVARRVASS